MQFQTLEIGKAPVRTDDPMSHLAPPGPAIRLSPPAPTPLAAWPVSDRIVQELSNLSTRITTIMPPGGGVLLEVMLHEERDNPYNWRGQRLLGIEIAGVGMVASWTAKIRLRHSGRRVRAP